MYVCTGVKGGDCTYAQGSRRGDCMYAQGSRRGGCVHRGDGTHRGHGGVMVRIGVRIGVMEG